MRRAGLLQVFDLFSHSTTLLVLAIVIGSVVGFYSPSVVTTASEFIDPTILLLVFLLLFEVPIQGVFQGIAKWRFLGISWAVNFILIPFVGFVIASAFLSGEPLFYTGLVIYFMAPCTDWFLGFTRLAKGDVELGAALLPINMLTQLILFPVYLLMFDTVVAYKVDLSSLVQWFVQPFLAAVILRLVLHRWIAKFLPLCKFAIPLVLMLLVGQIFAANIHQLIQQIAVLPLLLSAIFVFFVVTYLLAEGVAQVAKLHYPEHCLLTFTTAARNAPLMLGLATIALPNQPLIYAAITIGMLIEFPHLTALKAIMLRRYQAEQRASSIVEPGPGIIG